MRLRFTMPDLLHPPRSWRKYPQYFITLWLVAWLFLFLAFTVYDMLSLAPGGGYVEKRDCVAEDIGGRFGETLECVEYGRAYYVSVGQELLRQFIFVAIGTGAVVILLGAPGMYKAYQEEKGRRWLGW